MSKPFSKRLEVFASGLVYFAPAWFLVGVAAFIHHPLLLTLLLAANALTFAAVCQMGGIIPKSGYFQTALRRGIAYLILLIVYSLFTALVTAYPLYLLLRDQTLQTALLLSASVFLVLLAPWRLWPAFGLVFVWHDAHPADGRGTGIVAAIGRSLAFARQLTRDNDLFFGSGLIVSLSLSLLTLGALALAMFGTTLPEELLIGALAAYAVVLAPVAHWLITRSSQHALLIQTQRLVRRADMADAAVSDESSSELIVAPAAPDSTQQLTRSELNAMLLRSVRACQTDLALTALARGADPNAIPEPGERDQRSAVVLACVSPDLRLLRGLIAKGADVNRVNAGLPPLIAATRDSYQGRPDAVMTLLTNGADPRCTDADDNTPLHYAARAAHPIVAALLCDASAPVDAVNGDGQTALAIACAAGNRELARFLLDRGAQVEIERSQPALVAAAASADDDPELIKLLLKYKAHVDICDAFGRSALMTAALHGNADIAAILLKAGAQVDRADRHGATALMEAARAGSADVLDVLAAYGPNPEHTDQLGRTALMLAAQSAQASESLIRQLLGMGASWQSATIDGKRAVDFAAAAGRWNIVSQLDADYVLPASVGDAVAPAPSRGEESAAHLLDALRFGHWNIVEDFAVAQRAWPLVHRAQLFFDLGDHDDPRARAWLLAHGLDANAELGDGRTLFGALLSRLPSSLPAVRELVAAGAQASGVGMLEPVLDAFPSQSACQPELANLALDLIDRGADVFAVDRMGHSLLARSVASGSPRIATALLERGVDANVRDRHGRTPLFAALGLPADLAVACTRALIRAGADPEIAAINGETPLGLALASSNPELKRWLNWPQWRLPRRALRESDLPVVAHIGDAAALDKLLDLGMPIDAVDAQGATGLLRAAGAGHLDLVVHLLARGARPDRAARSGATPLSAAVSARRDSVVEAMLNHHVAVDQRLPSGGTALMIAAALGYPEIVARLIARGADPNAEDERGTRALHAAAQFAFVSRDTPRARRTLELLIGKGADIDASDGKGRTALLYLLGARAEPGSATDQNHLQALLSLFLVGRADVNKQDDRGVSALHACAMHGLLLPARALLAARADADCRDVLDRTPREVANLLGYVDVAAELSGRLSSAMPTPGQPATLR